MIVSRQLSRLDTGTDLHRQAWGGSPGGHCWGGLIGALCGNRRINTDADRTNTNARFAGVQRGQGSSLGNGQGYNGGDDSDELHGRNG